MTVSSHRLELLSPARDAAIAREAILHGADAVYIGGPGFGARHNASNSLKDIAELVPFAIVMVQKFSSRLTPFCMMMSWNPRNG